MFAGSFTTGHDLDSAFDIPEIEELTEAQFMQIKCGRFIVSAVERILNIPEDTLLIAAERFETQGGRPDLEWGICITIHRWVVEMPIFSTVWPNEIQPYAAQELGRIKCLPRAIKVDELVQLEGIYRLQELKPFIPFSPANIENQVEKIGCASRKVMGCWKNDSEFLVDMQTFLKWVISFKYC